MRAARPRMKTRETLSHSPCGCSCSDNFLYECCDRSVVGASGLAEAGRRGFSFSNAPQSRQRTGVSARPETASALQARHFIARSRPFRTGPRGRANARDVWAKKRGASAPRLLLEPRPRGHETAHGRRSLSGARSKHCFRVHEPSGSSWSFFEEAVLDARASVQIVSQLASSAS